MQQCAGIENGRGVLPTKSCLIWFFFLIWQNDDDRDTVGSCDNIPEPLNDQAEVTVLEIPTDFEGAPERV